MRQAVRYPMRLLMRLGPGYRPGDMALRAARRAHMSSDHVLDIIRRRTQQRIADIKAYCAEGRP